MTDMNAQPSTIAVVTATAIIAATAGYMVGTASSLGFFGSPRTSKKRKQPKESWPNSYDVKLHPDSSDEELMESLRENDGSSESVDDIGELKAFDENNEDCKLNLVVRTDLGMTKGT